MAATATRGRARQWALNALTLLASLSICVVVLELAVRLIDRDSEDRSDKAFHALRGWQYLPGEYREKPESALLSHVIRINQLGLRGAADPARKPDGVHRILVLGDSFTFGRAVPEEDLYTTGLAELLPDTSGQPVQVLNAGIEGYGTAQQLLLLRELTARGVVGDTYVLQVFTNDLLDNLRMQYSDLQPQLLQPMFQVGPDGRAVLTAAPDRGSWLPEGRDTRFHPRTLGVIKASAESFAQSRPSLIRLAQRLGAQVELPRMPGIVAAWYSPDILDKGLPLMAALLDEIRIEVDGLGARLLVVLVPSPFSVYAETYAPLVGSSFPGDRRANLFQADPARPQRELMKMCADLELACLDMQPVFEQQGTGALYFPREGHLTSEGHALLARAVSTELKQELRR